MNNSCLKASLILLVLSFTVLHSFGQQQVKQESKVERINPPFQQFYSKYLSYNGILIRAAEIVSNSALYVANEKLHMMLEHMPVVVGNLISNGVELHIIGKNQETSDLPEFQSRKGVQYIDNGTMTDIDKRTRGMGGVFASCGEENLLNLPSDRYGGGYDICVHEFAHSIMDFGIDSALRNKIVLQYRSSIAKGLWAGVYASSNEQEYWAELSSWYFGAHGDMLASSKPAAGPIALRAYDLDGYELLDSIYTGKLPSLVIQKKTRMVLKDTPSGNSLQKSKLIITNNSLKKLKVSWIDQNGKVIVYGDVLPSSTFEKETMYSHVWLIEGGDQPVYLQVFDPICAIQLSKDY